MCKYLRVGSKLAELEVTLENFSCGRLYLKYGILKLVYKEVNYIFIRCKPSFLFPLETMTVYDNWTNDDHTF